MRRTLKNYYILTKPGIVRGNAIAAIGGFFLASKGSVDFALFLAMLAGLSLIIASACVFNNYMDQGIDRVMKRTKNRPLITGAISGRNALIYATVLGVAGSLLLGFYTNILTLLTALFGLFAYVVLYGIGKRKTVHGTLIGSISGAIPPVVGYVAVTNQLDMGALLLFVILTFWQMPHFYAIAIFRKEDYAKAGIPVMPVEKSVEATIANIFLYTIGFVLSVPLLTVLGYTGYTYLAVMTVVGLAWLYKAAQGFRAVNDVKWARGIFGYSLISLLLFSIMISIDSLLP